MKRKVFLGMIVAVLSSATSMMFTSCSDDDSGPSVKVEVSEITGKTAKISWNIMSDRVLGHEIVIKEKQTGIIQFEETTGVDLSTSSVETSIIATGLSPETSYTVTVSALTVDENLDEVILGEGNKEFKTTIYEGSDLLEVTKDEIVGMWTSSNWYYKFNDDGTGETGSHSSTFGDEKEDDITWEITSFELDGVEVRSIKATDSNGYYTDLQVIKEGDIITLKDHDNNQTFKSSDNNGGEGLPKVEGITVEEDENMGFRFSWNAVDGASGYFIYINSESLSDIQISSIPYTANVEIEKHDTIKIEAWDQLKEEVIARGFIVYKEDEPSKINDLTYEVGDSHISFNWTEPDCIFSEVLIFYYEGLYTSGNHFDTIRVAKGTTTYDITGLNNLNHYTFEFFTFNGESKKKSEAAYASDLMPFPENSINLSNTYWKNENGTKSIKFDYRSDFSSTYRSAAEYKDGDFSKRLGYYFDFATNTGKMSNWDWNGWETSTEYFALSYNNETKVLTFADVDYTLAEE